MSNTLIAIALTLISLLSYLPSAQRAHVRVSLRYGIWSAVISGLICLAYSVAIFVLDYRVGIFYLLSFCVIELTSFRKRQRGDLLEYILEITK